MNDKGCLVICDILFNIFFRNILFNIFSIYNLIISIANLTSIPNDSKINLKINSKKPNIFALILDSPRI